MVYLWPFHILDVLLLKIGTEFNYEFYYDELGDGGSMLCFESFVRCTYGHDVWVALNQKWEIGVGLAGGPTLSR